MVTLHTMTREWLLCSWRLPRHPSRLRLAIWRRARRLGAVLLHDAIWILPAESKTREDFEWLAEEIEERGGTVLLWQATSLGVRQDRELVTRFQDDADARYAELAEDVAKAVSQVRRRGVKAPALNEALQRLRQLDRTLRLERRRDYFHAPGRGPAERTVTEALSALRARLEPARSPRRSRAVGD